MKTHILRLGIVFIVGLVIGFGVFPLFSKKADAPIAEEVVEEITQEKEQHTLLTVKDQPAGFRVAIEYANLDEVGWIVIRESREGLPGNILGARKFPKGESSGEVELLRNTLEESTYLAYVYTDNGDGVFDHKIDTPKLDSSGKEIVSSFEVIYLR